MGVGRALREHRVWGLRQPPDDSGAWQPIDHDFTRAGL